MKYLSFEWDKTKYIINEEKQPRMNKHIIRGKKMEEEYDLSQMKSRKNPYVKRLKKQITIRLAVDTIEYFKELSKENGMPYQNLIDMYLEDCANQHRKLSMHWD